MPEVTSNTSPSGKWYVGKLFWINGDLHRVTRVGERSEESNLIPMDVEKVEL